MLDALGGGGAYFFRTLVRRGRQHRRPGPHARRCGTWSGRARSPTTRSRRCGPCSPVAARRTSARRSGAARHALLRPGLDAGRAVRASGRARGRPGACPSRSGPPTAAGRWSLLPPTETDATVRAYATAEVLLDRYGVRDPRVGRGRGRRRRLRRRLPGAGRGRGVRPGAPRLLRRGPRRRAVRDRRARSTGSGPRAARCPGPATRTWTCRPRPASRDGPARRAPTDRARALVLAASDPANAYGAALPWPERDGRGGRPPPRPQGRRAGRARRRRARRSTSSVAARRCCPGPTSRRRCRPRPTRSRSPSARGPSAGSPSRRPTAARSSAPTTRWPPPWPRPGSMPPRAGCGCAGDRETAA